MTDILTRLREPLTDEELAAIKADTECFIGCENIWGNKTVCRLLDTIAEANAKCAVMMEALTPVIDFGSRINATSQDGGVTEVKLCDIGAVIEALADLPTAARALIEERDAAIEARDANYATCADMEADMKRATARAESAEARVAELEADVEHRRIELENRNAKVGRLQARIAALELTQRTAGMAEVCELCRVEPNTQANLEKYGEPNCFRPRCPLRPSPSVTP